MPKVKVNSHPNMELYQQLFKSYDKLKFLALPSLVSRACKSLVVRGKGIDA